eukprot:gene16889-19280_t
MTLLFRLALFLSAALVVHSSWLDYVQQIGRNRVTSAGSIQSDWPNTGFRFQFLATNTSANIEISFADCYGSCHSYVAVEVNCERVGKFEVSSSHLKVQQSLLTNKGQTYDIVLRKVTETSCGDAYGVLETSSIAVDGGDLLPVKKFRSICAKKNQLIVFGDSYTAAYGVDQLSPCSYSAATQDVTHGYAVLMADELEADIHVIAWSGKGAVRNYGDTNQVSANPLPTYYNRTLGGFAAPDVNTNYWDPKMYEPQVAIVMLGTNDYSTQPQPTDDQFTNALVDFVHQIESDYTNAKVLLLCAPGSPTVQCKNIKAAADATAVTYFEIPVDVWEGGVGCDGHPFTTTQQNMAEAVLPTVKQLLGL